MSELFKKITKKLEEKAKKFGFKGTDSVHVSLVLTEDEQKEFSSMKWNDHYNYEIKNNVLHMNYVEELAVYCGGLEKKFNITKLEKNMENLFMKEKEYIKLKMHFQRDKLRGLYTEHMQLIKKERYIL